MKIKIAIAGYRGLIGSAMAAEFSGQGHDVVRLGRSLLYREDDALAEALEGAEVVINLAGAPIIGRWTKSYMKEIADSRIRCTRNLVKAMHRLEKPPVLFISTSAAGIYEQGGPFTETNALLSSTFLGKLCQDWEKEAFVAEDVCRVVIFRFGIVLDRRQGALARLLPFFRAGIGGPVGNGRQPFPWIHLVDVVRASHFAIEKPDMKGVFNLAAPQLISNRQFSAALGKTLRRPALVPVPPFGLWLLFGKGSQTLTTGQAIIPQRLLDHGFSFHFTDITQALSNLLL